MRRQLGDDEELLARHPATVDPLAQYAPDRWLVQIDRRTVDVPIAGLERLVQCFLHLVVRSLSGYKQKISPQVHQPGRRDKYDCIARTHTDTLTLTRQVPKPRAGILWPFSNVRSILQAAAMVCACCVDGH